MRSTFLFLITALIVLGFVAFWSTYSVRFTEVAVVTTFGRAGEAAIRNVEGDESGIFLKWPYPVQSVTKYDTRVRVLQTRSETQLTRDQAQIVVESFLAWRIADPLVFFQRYSSQGPSARDHFRSAERTLESLLRSAIAEVSAYELKDLFNPVAGASKLGDLEAAILRRLASAGGEGRTLADFGVEPVQVGVSRVVLPQETTRAVYERMRAARESIAAEAQSQGESRASTIRSEAESAARRILAFADRRAQEIRNAGDLEAAKYLSSFAEDPELAVFLKNLEFMRLGLGKRATLVLPTTDFGFRLFDPRTISGVQGIPVLGEPRPQPHTSAKPANELSNQ